MGAYLSKTSDVQQLDNALPKYNRPVYTMADVHPQRVTFADPPASEAKPPASVKADSAEPVLKREGGRRRAVRTPALTTPTSVGNTKRSARLSRATPKAAALFASPAAGAPTATATVSPAAGSASAAAPRRRGRPAKKLAAESSKGAKATAVAAPAPELVVIGKAALHINQLAKRHRGAVPAQKVGMKHVAKRALKSVVQKGGRARRV